MREIRFRAWDKEKKKWFDFDSDESDLELLYQDNMWIITHTFDEDGNHPVYYQEEDFILMQSIGFKSIDGTEIYEEDIVQRVGGHMKFEVKYYDCGFMLGDTGNRVSSYGNTIKIIGHKYEGGKQWEF